MTKATTPAVAARPGSATMRMARARPKAFLAGLLSAIGLLATAAAQASSWLRGHPGPAEQLSEFIINAVEHGEQDVLSGKWYASTYYKDEDGEQIQTWSISVKGRSAVTVTIEDAAHKVSGVASGFLRHDTLAITYASEDVKRPGFGAYFLKEMVPATNGDGTIWIGTAVGHDCLKTEKDGNDTVCVSERLTSCPTILSQRPVPTPAQRAVYFTRGCQTVIWNDRDVASR